MWSFRVTEMSGHWRIWRGMGARHLHQSGTAVSPLRKVPTVVQPPGQASLNAWEAGHEVKPPSNGYAGGEVIMTSYQELTAGGESSLLFTGCCRAKEVTDRDVDCTTRWTWWWGGETAVQSRISRTSSLLNRLQQFDSVPSSPATMEHSGWVLMPCPLAAHAGRRGRALRDVDATTLITQLRRGRSAPGEVLVQTMSRWTFSQAGQRSWWRCQQ